MVYNSLITMPTQKTALLLGEMQLTPEGGKITTVAVLANSYVNRE